MTNIARSRPKPARPSRRQRVPPALTRGLEPFDGLAVLEEVPGDLGVLLWRSARNVALWAATPLEARARLFDRSAAETRRGEIARISPEAELLAPLLVVLTLLQTPGRVDLSRLVNACRRLALWAEQHGALGTALEFAQAAALAAPETAALAFNVGRLARRRAEYDRAESWYTRAIVQGRQTRDWRSYALAFSGMGNLHQQKGNFPLARRAHLRSLRAARRHALPELLGDAYHALFLVDVETGNCNHTDALAAEAFHAYGPHHPKLPRLAYDVAYHWTRRGVYPGAARVTEALLPHFEAPAERALVLGLMAWAGAGAGEPATFMRARMALDDVLAAGRAEDSAARALHSVARGAACLGDWAQAAEAPETALRVANERREGKWVIEAEAALEAARAHAGPALQEGPRENTEVLARSFVRVLRDAPPLRVAEGGLAAAV